MGKYIVIILVAIVIVAGWLFWKKDKKESENIAGTMTEKINNESLADGQYSLPNGGEVNWTGKKILVLGYEDHGVIKIKEGNFSVVNGNIDAGQVIFDMNSISTNRTGKEDGGGGDMLTRHLKSDDFFAVERFPEATFVISQVNMTEPGIYLVRGNLTVKDISNPVEFTAYAYKKDGQDMIKAELNIDRTNWDIKYGSNKFFADLADRAIDDIIYLSFDLSVSRQ